MAGTPTSAGAMATGTGAVTALFGAGAQAGDFAVLTVESANEAPTAPAGWTPITNTAGFGTAGAAGASRVAVFIKANITALDISGGIAVADTGDHTNAALVTYSNVDQSLNVSQGLPNGLSNSGVNLVSVATTAAATVTIPASVVRGGGILLAIIATDRDSGTVSANASPVWNNVTGTNNFVVNGSSASGAGGGIIINELQVSNDATGLVSFGCSITSSAYSSMLLYISAPRSPPFAPNPMLPLLCR